MMNLSTAAMALNVKLIGEDATFTSVGVDSRSIESGQLFVALKGDNFDGHDFVQQALQQGASGVLVTSEWYKNAGQKAMPALVVEDTYSALGELATYWRSQFNLPLIAITGSNGKTTVKEMLASILNLATHESNSVLATMGNFNNHIGLPLTLLKLNAQHRFAVIEMGMNHSGEIGYLTKVAKPSIAVITNAGNAHIGELGSLEAIAKAKSEIFDGLDLHGTAVINADDDFCGLWLALIEQHQIITYGLNNPALITAQYELQAQGSQLTIHSPAGTVDLYLHVAGEHNVRNALAATAVAFSMGIDLKVVAAGLERYEGVSGRLQHLTALKDALVIDDTYNANPASMKAAISVLAGHQGKKILVLGDMGELGETAKASHAEIGLFAKSAGIDALLAVGELSQGMVDAFGLGATHYQTKEKLIAALLQALAPNVVVLVKGSRFMAMEQIVNEIKLKNTMNKREAS